jgi:hypothetical protein
LGALLPLDAIEIPACADLEKQWTGPRKMDTTKFGSLTSWRCAMKVGPDRKYTVEFREAAARQVLDGGRSVPQVARSLEMSDKTLANWVTLLGPWPTD